MDNRVTPPTWGPPPPFKQALIDRVVAKKLVNITHLSCSPNFPRASITRYTHAKHEQILNCLASSTTTRRRNLLVTLAQYTVTHFRSSSTKSSSWFLSSLLTLKNCYSIEPPSYASTAYVVASYGPRFFSAVS